MDDDLLPQHLLVGAQLAVGVRGSSMYVSNQEETGKCGGWIRYVEDDLPFNLNELQVGGDAVVLDDPSKSTVDKNEKHDEKEQINNEVVDDGGRYRNQYEDMIRDLGWERLSPSIPENFSIFQDVQFHRDHMFDARYESPISGCDYVPGTLINEITRGDYMAAGRNKSKMETQDLLISDPVINDLFVTGPIQTITDLRNNNDQQTVIAYCSGETNSILKLAVLPENKLYLTNDTRELQGFFSKSCINGLGNFTSIDLKARIKSIKIASVSSLLGRSSDTVGVLTENALYFIKIGNIDPQTSHISYLMHEPVKSTSFGDFPFADFAFNPWEFQQIAAVDVKGNWGIARLPKYVRPNSKIRFLPNMRGSIFDPEELSSWKRIEWSSSYSKLLIISASKMIELDFCNDWQLEVVQAKTWSCLRDYRKIDDEFGALLTSKEIIIVSTKRTNQQVSRVISWKHCLDSDDQTLRLSIQKAPLGIKTLILVCIFSKGHDKVYVHGFCHDQDRNLVQSVDGPVVFSIPQVSKGISSMHFLPLDDDEKWITTETRGEKLRLNFCFKDNTTNRLMHCFFSNDETRDHPFIIPEANNSFASFFSFSARCIPDIAPIIDRTKRNILQESERETEPDDEVFQEFGYRLSEAINGFIALWENQETDSKRTPLLLSRLSDVPTVYESIQELDSFLHQLIGYYEASGITFTDFKNISKLLIQEESINLEVFFNKLLQCWDSVTNNSQSVTRRVFDHILWSTLRFDKFSNYDLIESNLRSSLSEPYSEILSHWDEDECESVDQASVNRLESGRPQLLSLTQESQIPTIKSSQQRSMRRGYHPRSSQIQSSLNMSFTPAEQDFPPSGDQFSILPSGSTPAFSLMSSPTPTLSQSQRSQRPRKKKKRIGGFG